MDIAEVLRLNNRATIDSLLPLTKVTSKAAIKKYSEMGYSVGMTAEEFSGKYPLLPIKNIFAANDMVSSLYYCELENELPIVIALQIFGKERLSLGDTDEQFQRHVLERANKLRYADISMIGAYLYSLNGSLLLSVLSTYVKRAKPSEELYDLFVGYYRDVDYGFSNIAIIQYHCIDDDASMQVLDKMRFHDKDSVILLYKILKDADALDRVRFGMRAVDVNYFRLPISPKLLPTAQTCLTGLEL